MDRGERTSFRLVAQGTRVESSDGVEVGQVKRVLIVEEKDLFDGIVIRTPSGERFVDAPEVGELYENLVTLKISAAAAERLPKPGRNPGVMDVDPDETAERDLAPGRLARRFWNRISGNY